MQHFSAESDGMTVGRICGKSSLYTILLADAATNSGFFHGKLAASARRKPCSGILPQMRPVYLFICALLSATILLFSHNRQCVQISHCFLAFTVSLCVLAVLLILSFFHNRSTHWLLWCIPFICYDVLFLLLTRKSHPQ